jgi:HAD superfamily hydrolase (TIGR01509 family)
VIPSRPRAIVFDMDGLLVDSERSTRGVWQAATTECGFELSDAVYLTLIGLGAEEAERTLSMRFGAGFDVSDFRRRRVARMERLLDGEGIPFKPGAEALLEWIATTGFPAGLATSSSRDEVRERLGPIAGRFATITTRHDVPRGKPAPDIYLAAARSLSAEPAECLALEDSFNGIRAAAAAGMPVVMVPDLAEPTPEIAALAVGVYPSLADVQRAMQAAWGEG